MCFEHSLSLPNSKRFAFQEAHEEEGKNVDVFRKLLESVDSNPDDSSVHFNLVMFIVVMVKRDSGYDSRWSGFFLMNMKMLFQGVFMWEKGEQEEQGWKEQAAEHFVRSAKLNPQNGDSFRYLGYYYARVSVDTQRAFKCYQRAVTLNPNDSDSGVSVFPYFPVEKKGSPLQALVLRSIKCQFCIRKRCVIC